MTNVTICCAQCTTPNRIPAERLSQGPKCGRCKQPIFNQQPVELNDANFNKVINHTDVPVILDCWASWCGPCQSFAPVFSAASERWEPQLRLAKLNTETNPHTATQLGIRSIPTLIAFKSGKEIQRLSGALPAQELDRWLQGLPAQG